MPPTEQAITARPPSPPAAPAAWSDPPRTDCPWCGSARLSARLRIRDPRRPVGFGLDRCRDCGHTFQNPRLTRQGLDLHHGDRPEDRAASARVIAAQRGIRRHRAAVRALLRFGEPESWLDVGCGRARFAAVARRAHPYIAFDGLDRDADVDRALAEGHIEEGHRGTLPELAPYLAGRYDALSMFHQLERALDPRRELVAARTVLRPGGHLLIETSDPDSRSAGLLGRWWAAYRQPWQLHLMPLGNLRRCLEDLGFTVVAAERRAAHLPRDLAAGTAQLLDRRLPTPRRDASPGGASGVLARAAFPAVTLALAADRLLAPALRRTRFANAYRIIARRDD